jgi:general secretion pathway protein D
MLVPHIVRESILTGLNTRAIDTGTGQSIELRHVESPAEQPGADLGNPGLTPKPAIGPATTAANAAAAMVDQLRQQVQPLSPPTTPAQAQPQAQIQPAQSTNPAAVSLSVEPANSTQTVGSTFQVAVMLGNGHDVYSVPLQLQYNPAVLQLVNVDAGNFLGRDGQAVALGHRDDNGVVTVSASRPPNAGGVNGQGSVANFTFKAIAAGDSSLALVKVGALNSAQANIPATGSQAVVHVK